MLQHRELWKQANKKMRKIQGDLIYLIISGLLEKVKEEKMIMPNGYGSVYKLSGNRRKPYAVRVTEIWSNGQQKYRYIGYYRTKQEAIKQLALYNDAPYDLEMSKVTFSEIYRRWYDDTFDEESNRSTVKNYTAAYKHCKPLYNMKMSDIRPSHMQDIINSCDKGYQTQKRIHILFNKLYKWCLDHDCLTKNYSSLVKVTQKDEPSVRHAFSSEEIQLIWDNVDKNEYISLLLILIYSGVRISELLNLKKKDVHLDEQWFYVRASKTNAGIRVVPIADKVLPFWRHFMKLSSCQYAVCNAGGDQLTYDNFKKRYFFPIMEKFGMNHTPHETRHTFISMAAMKNINQTIIKKIVGHKSIMNLTEEVYTHIEVKALLEAVNKL